MWDATTKKITPRKTRQAGRKKSVRAGKREKKGQSGAIRGLHQGLIKHDRALEKKVLLADERQKKENLHRQYHAKGEKRGAVSDPKYAVLQHGRGTKKPSLLLLIKNSVGSRQAVQNGKAAPPSLKEIRNACNESSRAATQKKEKKLFSTNNKKEAITGKKKKKKMSR